MPVARAGQAPSVTTWLAAANSQSVLRLLPPVCLASNVQLKWESMEGVPYQIEFCTNVATPTRFQQLSPVIPGETNVTSFYDMDANWLLPRFYRVRVVEPRVLVW